MILGHATLLKLAWLGVVLLVIGEVALVGGVQWHYYSYRRSAPHGIVLFWAEALMGAALVVSGLAFLAFLFAFTGTRRRILAGTAVLIASLVVSFVVISINAWAYSQ